MVALSKAIDRTWITRQASIDRGPGFVQATEIPERLDGGAGDERTAGVDLEGTFEDRLGQIRASEQPEEVIPAEGEELEIVPARLAQPYYPPLPFVVVNR